MANMSPVYRPDRTSQVADSALTQLIRRLEAATSRLEDIASSTASFEQPTANGAPSGTVHQTSSMPELPTVSGDSPQPPSQPAAPAQAALPATIIDMDNMITGDLKKFVDAGEGLDKIIADQVGTFSICHS